MNYKEIDIGKVEAYLQGKEHVEVSDIESESGADKLRVHIIIIELALEGRMKVEQATIFGAPKVVTLIG